MEFLESIALFGTPALIALPARFQVMTTMLWQMFEFPPRVQVAAAYAMPLLLVTVFLFWLQYRIMARKGYVALTGKGGERRLVRLGPWRWVLLGYCLFVTSLSFFMPMLVVLQAAFARAWGRGFSWDNVTTAQPALRAVRADRHPRRHPEHLRLRRGGLGHRARPRARHRLHRGAAGCVPLGRALTYVAMAPFVIPGHRARDRLLRRLHRAAARALRHRVDPDPGLRDPLPAHRVHQQRRRAPQSINPELEDAARILGAGRLLSLRRIVAPLLRRGLAGAFILVFIPATRELSSAIFLYTTGTQVLSVLLFDKSDEGNFEVLSSMGLILVVVRWRWCWWASAWWAATSCCGGPPREPAGPRSISRRFGGVTAVDRVSLTLQAGEFVSLLGPSGCGKTTTLRMVAGFLDPSEGTIEMDGRRLSSPGATVPPEKRNMSMIFQSYAIWPNMTVAQNVAFGLEVRRLPGDEIRIKVGASSTWCRWATSRGAIPRSCPAASSSGWRWPAPSWSQPAVLLLDEPLSNLDANLREEMRYEIRRLHDEFHITTVYVTHDQAEAMVTSDRIAVMNQGRIEQVDAPRALYARPRTRFVAGFIGRTNLLGGARARRRRGVRPLHDRAATRFAGGRRARRAR